MTFMRLLLERARYSGKQRVHLKKTRFKKVFKRYAIPVCSFVIMVHFNRTNNSNTTGAEPGFHWKNICV